MFVGSQFQPPLLLSYPEEGSRFLPETETYARLYSITYLTTVLSYPEEGSRFLPDNKHVIFMSSLCSYLGLFLGVMWPEREIGHPRSPVSLHVVLRHKSRTDGRTDDCPYKVASHMNSSE
jgi:hypothetical protein